jgi:hypothetical protein
MVDFNLDYISESNNNNFQLSNKVDILLQSINLLFETSKDELFGNTEYGTNYEVFLYDLKANSDQITNQVYKDIYSLGSDILGNYKVNVNTILLQGTERDIALIEIDIYDPINKENYNKIYRLE